MLGTHRASAFSAGNPSAFREAYNATIAFLQGLESLCPTLGVVQSFRKHSSVMALMRKFNVSVYFTLRFQARARNNSTRATMSLPLHTNYICMYLLCPGFWQEIAEILESSISDVTQATTSTSAAPSGSPSATPPPPTPPSQLVALPLAPKDENYGFRLQITTSLWK